MSRKLQMDQNGKRKTPFPTRKGKKKTLFPFLWDIFEGDQLFSLDLPTKPSHVWAFYAGDLVFLNYFPFFAI